MLSQYLTRAEAAEYLRLSVGTLENWAIQRKNLPYRRHGRIAIYLREDLDAFSQSTVIKCLRYSMEASERR